MGIDGQELPERTMRSRREGAGDEYYSQTSLDWGGLPSYLRSVARAVFLSGACEQDPCAVGVPSGLVRSAARRGWTSDQSNGNLFVVNSRTNQVLVG